MSTVRLPTPRPPTTTFLEEHRRVGTVITLFLLIAVGAVAGAVTGTLLSRVADLLLAQIGSVP